MQESIHTYINLIYNLSTVCNFAEYFLSRFKECVDTTEAVIDVTWEELNTGHWSLVPECQRRVYAVSSLLKV